MLARVARLMCVSNKFLAGEMMQDALQLSKSIREITFLMELRLMYNGSKCDHGLTPQIYLKHKNKTLKGECFFSLRKWAKYESVKCSLLHRQMFPQKLLIIHLHARCVSSKKVPVWFVEHGFNKKKAKNGCIWLRSRRGMASIISTVTLVRKTPWGLMQ